MAPNEEPRVRPMSQTEIKQLECLSDLARRKIRDVPEQAARQMCNRAGHLQVMHVPSMEEVGSISISRAIRTLRLCPYSQYFGETQD